MSNDEIMDSQLNEQIDSNLQFTKELTESKITDKLKAKNTEFDKYSSKIHNNWKTYYNAYRNMSFTVEEVAVKVPEIFTIIETEIPFLLNAIYGHSQIIDATAKYDDPDGTRTYKVKSYINKLIKDICKGKIKSEMIIKNMLIYGMSPVKMFWNTDPEKDIDPQTKQSININSSHPDFYLIDPFDFAWPPDFTEQRLDNIEWVRERIFLSKDKMKSLRDQGKCAKFSDDELGQSSGTSGSDNGAEGKDKGSKLRNGQSEEKNQVYYDEFYITLYVKESNGKIDAETSLPIPMDESNDETYDIVPQEYRAWLLSNNKVIKFEKNEFGYKPFLVVRAYENPDEFVGMGEPEVIGPIAAQLSYTHAQSGKMVKKIGQSMTWIDPSAGLSPSNLNRIEGGVGFVKNIGGIKSEQTTDPQNVKVLVEYKEHLDSEIEKITGVSKSLQGEYTGDITATQASIVAQNSSNRLASKLSHLQEEFIVPLAEIFFLMSKQLIQLPVAFFDNNNNLLDITPDDFIGNYEWTSLGSIAQSNKALALSQNQQLLGGIIQLAQASAQTPYPFTVNIPEFIRQHLAPYANLPDINNIIITSQSQGQNTPQQLPPDQGLQSNTPLPAKTPGNLPVIPVNQEPGANLGAPPPGQVLSSFNQQERVS